MKELQKLMQDDKVTTMALLDETGVVLLQRELWDEDINKGTLVLMTEDLDDDEEDGAVVIGGMSDYELMFMLNRIIADIAERRGQSLMSIAITAALGMFECEEDDRCDNCEHECNEDCGNVGTDNLHSDWHDNMEG